VVQAGVAWLQKTSYSDLAGSELAVKALLLSVSRWSDMHADLDSDALLLPITCLPNWQTFTMSPRVGMHGIEFADFPDFETATSKTIDPAWPLARYCRTLNRSLLF
jgi:hypothetical protein